MTRLSSNYVPYGPNYAISGKEVFMYTGKPYDSVTGLYYFAARYYDPTIGRFVTEDSYSGSKEDPQSRNRYSYARDNPMKLKDPTGHVVVGLVDGGSTSGTTSVSTCTAAGDYCLSTYAGYGGTLATCTASADVCLGRMGVADPVSSAQQASSCLSGLCGAAAVAGGALAVTLAVAATGAIATFGAFLGLGALAIGTGFAIGYVIKNGYGSTPGGALNAFISGVTLPFHLPNPLGSLGFPQWPPGPLPSLGPAPLSWLFSWL